VTREPLSLYHMLLESGFDCVIAILRSFCRMAVFSYFSTDFHRNSKIFFWVSVYNTGWEFMHPIIGKKNPCYARVCTVCFFGSLSFIFIINYINVMFEINDMQCEWSELWFICLVISKCYYSHSHLLNISSDNTDCWNGVQIRESILNIEMLSLVLFLSISNSISCRSQLVNFFI